MSNQNKNNGLAKITSFFIPLQDNFQPMKAAVFPGSFDPITLGHKDIIDRALPLFDQLIIAIGVNVDKKYMFDVETRMKMIELVYQNQPKIKVVRYKGLTVDFCHNNNLKFIVRGLRNPADFEFEKAIAQTNRKLGGVETVFLLTGPETSFISSSIVRDIFHNGGDISSLVPNEIIPLIRQSI